MTIEELIAMLPPGSYLAGGAARAHIMQYDERIRDVDLFFVDHDTYLVASQTLYYAFWRGESENEPGTHRVFHPLSPWPIDVVAGRTAPDLSSLLCGFDFRACQFGWSRETGWISLPGAFDDAKDHVLRLVQINGSAKRTRVRVDRYLSRGWTIDTESDARLKSAQYEEAINGPDPNAPPY